MTCGAMRTRDPLPLRERRAEPCRRPEFGFDLKRAVVFGDALTPAHRTSLDLSDADRHGEVDQQCSLAGAMRGDIAPSRTAAWNALTIRAWRPAVTSTRHVAVSLAWLATGEDGLERGSEEAKIRW